MSELKYLSGFGNYFETEALAGTLPEGQNSPQRVAHGLYAEQLSGSAFTAPRSENIYSWLYRICPSVVHSDFEKFDHPTFSSSSSSHPAAPPTQMRWDPLPLPKKPTDFITGLVTFATNGDLHSRSGSAIHLYSANTSMDDSFFMNADGDFLIVPQEGALKIQTEFGFLAVAPKEIAVVQRGIKFRVLLQDQHARGYVCENYGNPFELPSLGPIGANGLAYPRDFKTPVAAYEDVKSQWTMINKFQGNFWKATQNHSPFDVVGWHGCYAPYKYDLEQFQVMNSVNKDHADPSIFTVLTSPGMKPGTANVDFVIFPPRWIVQENTFRPPYYHRNIMSEFMGNIHGIYDAKEDGFLPGGASLHNCMSAHGPDAEVFEKASHSSEKPVYQGDTLSFMFESQFVYRPTAHALKSPERQSQYLECWQGLKKQFSP